jgi:hypothetical protein
MKANLSFIHIQVDRIERPRGGDRMQRGGLPGSRGFDGWAYNLRIASSDRNRGLDLAGSLVDTSRPGGSKISQIGFDPCR